MKYNMSTPMSNTLVIRRTRCGRVLSCTLMPVFSAQFTSLHQATLFYRAILRPSQHLTFPVYITLPCPTLARTHTREAGLFLLGWRGCLNS